VVVTVEKNADKGTGDETDVDRSRVVVVGTTAMTSRSNGIKRFKTRNMLFFMLFL